MNEIVIGTLTKYSEDQARASNGEFGSGQGETPVPHGKNEMVVSGDKIKVGDVIHSKNELMNGGKVVQITPAKAGNEDRGPRIKLEFKNGKRISNYFKPGNKYLVTRGTQASALTAPAKELGGGNKPDGGGVKPPGDGVKPPGGGKPVPEPPQPASDKEYSRTYRLPAASIKVGDKINVGDNFNDKLVTVESVKSTQGMREFTYTDENGDKQVFRRSADSMTLTQSAVSVLGNDEERRIPRQQVDGPNGEKFGRMAYTSFDALKEGDRVHLPGNFNARYGASFSDPGTLVGIRPQGRGRIDYLIRQDDGKILVRSYTAKERSKNSPRAISPLSETAYGRYQVAAADKIKADQEQKERQAKIDAENAAKMVVETGRRTAEMDAFKSAIAAKADELNASSPAAPFSAGDVRNGGWGMTNADLAKICAAPGNLDGAEVKRVQANGAINAGTFRVTAANGEPLFAKQIKSGYREVANEVLGSLISQRIGLNSAATIPCYIDTANGQTKISTTPQPGKEFNGVIMDRIRDSAGKALPFGGQAGPTAIRNSDPEQLQRMALLDALIGNTDRHADNFFLDPKAGVIPYDAGFGFGQVGTGLYADRSMALRENPAMYEVTDLIGKNSGLYVNLRTDQAVALQALSMSPLMVDSTKDAKGNVTVTPTPFAATLRDQVLSAAADFKRSYENPALGVEMNATPSGLASGGNDNGGGAIDINSGVGYGMLGGAVAQILGAGPAAIASNTSYKITLSDPSGVLSTAQKAIISMLNKTNIGTLKRKNQ